MFLNEGTYYNVNSKYPNISADPITGLNIISESNSVWNDLTFKMIKLEHTAIINRDNRLLQEGMSEFKDKVVNFFKELYEKIKAFITKVIASLLQSIANMKKIKAKYDKAWSDLPEADGEIKTTYTKNITKVYKVAEAAAIDNMAIVNDLMSIAQGASNGVENVVDKFNTLIEGFESSVEIYDNLGEADRYDVTKDVYEASRKFLFNPKVRQKAIENLKKSEKVASYIKNIGIKAVKFINNEVQSSDSSTEDQKKNAESLSGKYITTIKDTMTSVQRFITFMIRAINRAVIESFRIVRAVHSQKNKNSKKDKKEKSEGYGILDRF